MSTRVIHYTLKELANRFDLKLQGDPSTRISGVASLARGAKGDLSFLSGLPFQHELAKTNVSAVVLTQKNAPI